MSSSCHVPAVHARSKFDVDGIESCKEVNIWQLWGEIGSVPRELRTDDHLLKTGRFRITPHRFYLEIASNAVGIQLNMAVSASGMASSPSGVDFDHYRGFVNR